MQILLISSGDVIEASEFHALYPNTSFPYPLTDAVLESFDAAVVNYAPQPSVQPGEKVEVDGAELIDGEWFLAYKVVPQTPEEYAAATEQRASTVRKDRAFLLAACDWTQLLDSPLSSGDQAVWATYRQALRDIPDQSGFPYEVEWPAKP